MAHRDAIVHRDRVELAGYRPGGPDRVRDHGADLLQVHVAGHELGEAVGDRDDRLADLLRRDAGRAQQRARAHHVPAVRDRPGPQGWHDDRTPLKNAPRTPAYLSPGGGAPGITRLPALPGRRRWARRILP